MYQKDYHIFFAGIGGIGMSGIAEILLKQGFKVSGSDLKEGPITRRLASMGAVIHEGHREENIIDPDVVVVTSAIGSDNPEVAAAGKKGIPVIKRAQMLAEIMRSKHAVAVSGAHGKTTTTSLTAAVLEGGNLDPTVVVGGIMKDRGTNAKLGESRFVVAEADESDGSFLHFNPAIAIVTNIDLEHLDFYDGISEIKEIFVKFLEKIPFYGLAVLCQDNEHVRSITDQVKCRKLTYGIENKADLMAENILSNGSTSTYDAVLKGKKLGTVTLNLAGIHNVYNSLASMAAGLELGIPFESIAESLSGVAGVKRRLDIKGEENDILVVDDYGHHPTEIGTTLSAARKSWPERRIITIFQPHRYSRTHALLDGFSESFDHADILFLLPIYAASETNTWGIDSRDLLEMISQRKTTTPHFAETRENCIARIKEIVKPGDLVLTMGAGDVWKTGEELLSELREN